MHSPLPNYRARRWFKTKEEFIQACGDAVSLARGECNEQFAADTLKKAKHYGIESFMSEKQLLYLCKLADRVPPLPMDSEDDDAER